MGLRTLFSPTAFNLPSVDFGLCCSGVFALNGLLTANAIVVFLLPNIWARVTAIAAVSGAVFFQAVSIASYYNSEVRETQSVFIAVRKCRTIVHAAKGRRLNGRAPFDSAVRVRVHDVPAGHPLGQEHAEEDRREGNLVPREAQEAV